MEHLNLARIKSQPVCSIRLSMDSTRYLIAPEIQPGEAAGWGPKSVGQARCASIAYMIHAAPTKHN